MILLISISFMANLHIEVVTLDEMCRAVKGSIEVGYLLFEWAGKTLVVNLEQGPISYSCLSTTSS